MISVTVSVGLGVFSVAITITVSDFRDNTSFKGCMMITSTDLHQFVSDLVTLTLFQCQKGQAESVLKNPFIACPLEVIWRPAPSLACCSLLLGAKLSSGTFEAKFSN